MRAEMLVRVNTHRTLQLATLLMNNTFLTHPDSFSGLREFIRTKHAGNQKGLYSSMLVPIIQLIVVKGIQTYKNKNSRHMPISERRLVYMTYFWTRKAGPKTLL